MTAHRYHPHVGFLHFTIDWSRLGLEEGETTTIGQIPLMAQVPIDDSPIVCDPDDAVLYDGCERCAQHARHPFDSLDDDHLRPLIEAALSQQAYEIPEQPTRTQQIACRNIRTEWRRSLALLDRVRAAGGEPLMWNWAGEPAPVSDLRPVEEVDTDAT